ncbi:Arylsulfatase [Planctomycetes bacterium CA13]|uniref:Arylsulfatase n=1 Tax=Novipirellula herctigrandis TaxID=2527986 RepID=A0A5C5ZAZ2_9BACT|nr:Arylsulfatase [Planctomycetes bacterium CA13]
MRIPARFLLTSFLFVIAAIGPRTASADDQPVRPNIVLCMADDLGWGDVGYNGHPHIKTPHLDQMAKAGARLDRFYVGSPLCVPSRAGLLTGRIATRCGISNHRGAVSHLKAEELTIAELVKSKGYTTGHFGKWHLGMLTPDYKGDKDVLMTPGMAGFDEWFASPSSVATHNPYTDPGGIGRALGGQSSPKPIDLRAGYIHNGNPLDEPIEGCAAEIVMDRAIPFIRESTKKEQPFLAVIWFNPPHTPVVGHPKYMKEMYSGLPENQQHYYSLATAIDAQMGRLRQELRDLGIADDTLLAFTSDNGPGPPIGRTKKAEARLQGSAGSFRERKASLYEGGIREPGLIEWPSQIKSGTVVKTPCSTLDYLPTLAKLLGIELPNRPYDGVDILPILRGEGQERGEPIAFYFRDAVALSGERFKLVSAEQSKGKRSGGAVSFTDKKFELFDLENDPGEKNDIAQKHPKVVKEMKSQLRQWVDSVEQSRLGKDYESADSTPPTPTASGEASERRTHLFLCSGQSNMKNLDLSVSFTPTLKQAFPNDEVIVTKVAYGGRGISRWVPRAKIYTELLAAAKKASTGKKIDTMTFVWMQGEKDHQEDATTTAYERNLKTLYQQLSEDFDRDDINWVIGRLSDARLGTANWDAIRQIQVDVADNHARAAWVNTDDLNGANNGVHCPPGGYKQMGLRFADKAIGLIKQSGKRKADQAIKPKTNAGIPVGTNVRIIPLASALKSKDGFAQWMFPDQYTAQDILEMIDKLKPQVLERYITGKQNIDAMVPVRRGHEPMNVGEFLNASINAGSPGCVIVPKLNLTWISWGREKYFWETAENYFSLPLTRPIRIVNLDNWKDFLEKHGDKKATEVLKRLKKIGFESIGVNMAGGFNEGYGYLSFADFLINSQTWELRLSTLEKMKRDPHLTQYYLYIDYPGQMNDFMELPGDQQADVFTKLIQPAEKTHDFIFVYPILFDQWDATKQLTSQSGEYQGATLFEVIQQSVNPRVKNEGAAQDEKDFVLHNKPLPPLKDGAWTAVIIPDTQTYTTLRKGREENVQILDQMFQWMATNKKTRNIQVAVHVGDMTSKNEPKEWEKIRGSYRNIDGVVPYVVCVGNHDEKPINRTAHLDEYFKIADNPLNEEFFVASFEEDNLENAYYVMEQNGQKLLFMALEFLPRDKVVAWADAIIKKHTDHHVFLTIHEYISEKSRLTSKDGLPSPELSDKEDYLRSFRSEADNINCGVDIKAKLIDPNPNVEFLVCGHYGCQIINERGQAVFDRQEIATAHCSDPRDNGAKFHAMLFNAQWMSSGGDGWLLLLEFQPDNQSVHVRTYSPYLKAFRTGPEYDYVLRRSD